MSLYSPNDLNVSARTRISHGSIWSHEATAHSGGLASNRSAKAAALAAATSASCTATDR